MIAEAATRADEESSVAETNSSLEGFSLKTSRSKKTSAKMRQSENAGNLFILVYIQLYDHSRDQGNRMLHNHDYATTPDYLKN